MNILERLENGLVIGDGGFVFSLESKLRFFTKIKEVKGKKINIIIEIIIQIFFQSVIDKK